MVKNVLILFAHPALQRSRVNNALANVVRQLPGVTFHDLYEHYPDFDIDVSREQRLLEDHDIVVMQHPFFWYSTPAILKEWQDLVLEYGWAYGSSGNALMGKRMLSAISTGGNADAYRPEGYNRHTVRDLLAPLAQTAELCGMNYLPPFLTQGVHVIEQREIDARADLYRSVITGLRDDSIVIPTGKPFSWEEVVHGS